MKKEIELPKRKNIRLKDYDYSKDGAYHITICVKNGKCLLWDMAGATFERPKLSEIGNIVDVEIKKLCTIYEKVIIDKYVVMPNHIHMIIIIFDNAENGRPKVAPTVSRIIQQFKGSVSKKVGFSLWQKLFYDRIIRDEDEYIEKWNYIENNPIKWKLDKYYCE